MKRKHKGRPGLTKEDLLPMHSVFVRQVSLRAHLSLSNIRGGHGTKEAFLFLQRVLYLTAFMTEVDRGESDDLLFTHVEATLDEGIRADEWQIPEDRLQSIEQILLRFDEAIGTVSLHQISAAVGKLQRLSDTLQT
ncbi:hypothetical protein, partial [Burkholderia diffusa]|uniref:hypothetical protein n=1 Tax=Burkholderia diffusa TaxID=488732 RepID=UPI002AB30B8F